MFGLIELVLALCLETYLAPSQWTSNANLVRLAHAAGLFDERLTIAVDLLHSRNFALLQELLPGLPEIAGTSVVIQAAATISQDNIILRELTGNGIVLSSRGVQIEGERIVLLLSMLVTVLWGLLFSGLGLLIRSRRLVSA